MKWILTLFLMFSFTACEEQEAEVTADLVCSGKSITSSETGLRYNFPQIKSGASKTLEAEVSISSGRIVYAMTASCLGEDVSFSEAFLTAKCFVGFSYNALGEICESDTSISYLSSNLSLDGRLKILDLDSVLNTSSSNTFRVLVNGVETFASDVSVELAAKKIELHESLDNSLSLLSSDYSFSAAEGDRICFELSSETRTHCYTKNNPTPSATAELPATVYDAPLFIDLSDVSSYEALNFRGALRSASVNALDERKNSVVTAYQELDHSGFHFNAEFSLEQGESYRLEFEANGKSSASSLEVVLFRKSSFDVSNLQDGFLKKFKVDFQDSSLRRKKVQFDFVPSAFEQTEELVVLIYGENSAYIKDFNLSVTPEQSAKSLSVFMSSAPNRSFGQLNYVPDQYVPFGMPGAYAYGQFKVNDSEADYEIYTSFEGKFKTTGAHLYAKNDSNHDADLSLNFRGASVSSPGKDSGDFLHGTGALDTGYDLLWSEIKTDPFVAIMILHTEGGHFALNGGFLKPYSPFGDETSAGGVQESALATRFNNRVGKTLDDRIKNVDNDRDPDAPFKDPMALENNSFDYFPDLFGGIYVEDDGSGGTQLNSLGTSQGYDLTTPYLFYLFDDQGSAWNAGGPEGAVVGAFMEQVSFEDYLSNNSLSAGVDADSDGFSNYVEYIVGSAPGNTGSFPSLDAYDLFDDEGNMLKVVTFNISKTAMNFGINIYETRFNGVESHIWSFDRGRGFESTNLIDAVETEENISITVKANGSPLEISTMRVSFN